MATPSSASEPGGPAQLLSLIEEHEPALRAYVQLSLSPQLRDRESVSDVVQSAIRELLENPGAFRYQGDAQFRAWLHTVARNKILSKVRAYGALKRGGPLRAGEEMPDRLDPGPTPSECAARSEELALLQDALDELSEEDGELIRMHRILGISIEAIARIQSVPSSTVGSRIARIMTVLAQRMKSIDERLSAP